MATAARIIVTGLLVIVATLVADDSYRRIKLKDASAAQARAEEDLEGFAKSCLNGWVGRRIKGGGTIVNGDGKSFTCYAFPQEES